MILLVALLMASWLQTPNVPSQDKAQAQKASPTAGGQSEKTDKAITASAQNTPTPQKNGNDAAKDNANCFDKNLHRAYELATILGVVGGILGLYFIWRQSGHTERAAQSAKESSDAALLNAKAIINAERPWLFIEIKTTAHPPVHPGVVPEHMNFCVNFRNWGKTPAEVVGFDQHLDCTKDTMDLPSPPGYSLEGQVMVHTRMVPPGESWENPGEPCFSPHTFLVDDQWKDIRNSQKRFMYWGRIQYRDLIEESKTIHELKKDRPITIHETCFCYFWSPPLNEFLVAGPVGYNGHT